jgi:adenosylhomocysteine nucleosidase
MLRWLLQNWLGNAAKTTLRDAVAQAAQKQLLNPTTEIEPLEAPKPCHLGIVFALSIESGCFEDQLQGLLTLRGGGFVLREGGLRGQRVVVILSTAGQTNAAHATEILIDGHHPQRVISAGFAGALSPDLKRNDILLADRLRTVVDGDMPVELPPQLTASLSQTGVHRGTLLTSDHVVRLPRDKQTFFHRYEAAAVEMETFAVAEICRQRKMPFTSVRVINDTADETLTPDVEHLLSQKSGPAQWGAALGAVWRRPANAKDMYHLYENALIASDRLAKFLIQCDFGSER